MMTVSDLRQKHLQQINFRNVETLSLAGLIGVPVSLLHLCNAPYKTAISSTRKHLLLFCSCSNTGSCAGEMAQWLRELAVLPEIQGLIPSNHMAAHHCSTSSRGPENIWAPRSPGTSMVHRYIGRKKLIHVK